MSAASTGKIIEIYDPADHNDDEIDDDDEYNRNQNISYIDPMFRNGILRETLHELIRHLDHEDIKFNEDFDMIRKLYPYAVLGNITKEEYFELSNPIFPLASKHIKEGNDDIYACWMEVKRSLAIIPICKEA